MQLSLNWLKEFVEIPKSVTPEELAEKLTAHTVEVEKIEYQADKYKNVAVGKILEIKPHPNADRLRLALVDIGKEKLEIVCGAPNIAVGQFVPVALAGAALPGGLEIKPAEIRGVKSNGMLCAEDELGLGANHDGIMILDKAKVGQNFSEFLKLNDVIFEVDNKSITHRADLWSHYGLARDIAAFLNVKFKPLKIKNPLNLFVSEAAKISVKIEDFKLCPRYMAIGLLGIKVAPSPEWLRNRLSAAGMRPINNIVDATNYVMLELGQPLHAFDKNFIDSLIVRRAKSGEIMKTLDGLTRKLEPDMLVIADKTKPVAIAGVMGGLNSEIGEQTTDIVIEAANFNFDSVRKTAQKLGLRTEASLRFEKGLDPNLAELGLARAVELILKICPSAKVASQPVDEKRYKLNQGPIKFDLNWLNQRAGHKFELKYVKQVLEKLGFAIKIKRSRTPAKGAGLLATVPTWRAARDISLAEDIVEEVVRIYGYNNIKPVMPKAAAQPPLANKEKSLERKIKNILSVGAGLAETYNYSFVGRARLEKLKFDSSPALKLANPLSQDLAVLRPSLAPGLFENIKTNQAKEDYIGLYEIGRIFLNKPGADDLPFQEKHLGLALAGGQEDLFRKLKGIIEYLFNSLDLSVKFEAAEEAAAAIYANGREIGRASELAAGPAQALGIKKKAAIAEIRLNDLFAAIKNSPAKQFKEPPKYPPAVRDLAFVVNEKILYNQIKGEIENFSGLIKRLELFDAFQGGRLGQNNKNLAFHIIYQADKTLTSEEVDEIQAKLIKHLERKFGAKIRDF